MPTTQQVFCAKGNPLGRETLGGKCDWHFPLSSTHFVFEIKSGHFLPFSLPCSNVTEKRLHSTSFTSKGLETCSNKPQSYPLNMTGLTSPLFTRVCSCSPGAQFSEASGAHFAISNSGCAALPDAAEASILLSLLPWRVNRPGTSG